MNKQSIRAQIEAINPLTDSITQLILHPEEFKTYQAGQYLNIHIGENYLSFSIANAPLGSKKYELHIRHSRNNPSNQALFSQIKDKGFVDIELPFGFTSLDKLDPDRPIIFIAGGTGFAPVHAMIEQLLANDDPRSFELFWGARSQGDLYMDEKVERWQNHAEKFSYFSVISEENKPSLSTLVLQQHVKDLRNWQIVISGPFNMVYAVRDVLVRQGVAETQLYSDAF